MVQTTFVGHHVFQVKELDHVLIFDDFTGKIRPPAEFVCVVSVTHSHTRVCTQTHTQAAKLFTDWMVFLYGLHWYPVTVATHCWFCIQHCVFCIFTEIKVAFLKCLMSWLMVEVFVHRRY